METFQSSSACRASGVAGLGRAQRGRLSCRASGGAGRDANGEGMVAAREDAVRCRAGGHSAKAAGVESSGV